MKEEPPRPRAGECQGANSLVTAGLFALLRGGRVGNVSGVGAGLLGWLGSGPGNTVLGWMAPGLGGGLEGGGMFALILGLVSALVTILIDASSTETQEEKSAKSVYRCFVSGLRNGAFGGGIVGGCAGLLFFWTSGSWSAALPRGLGFGLFSGLVIGLLSALVAGLRVPSAQDPATFVSNNQPVSFLTHLLDGIVIGFCAWLGFGIVDWLLLGWEQGVIYGAIVGLLFCVTFSFGGGTALIRGLGTTIKSAETIGWNGQNVRRNWVTNVRNPRPWAGGLKLPERVIPSLT